MPEKIVNGSFDSGFDYWTNPTGGGEAFTLDAGKAKAISNALNTTPIEHSMLQGFANSDYVLSGKISVWGQWNVPSGNISNGSCRFRVRLVDPTSTSHTLLDTTKTPEVSSGWLLNNEDITAKFGSYGNFVLKLDCYPASAKNDNQASVSNPYTSWTKSPEIVMYDGNNKIKVVSYSSGGGDKTGVATKTFVVDKPSYDSRITVKVKGFQPGLPGDKAYGSIVLIKPSSERITLWNGDYADDIWHTVLNNADITAHVQAAGTYELEFFAAVASGWEEETEQWIPSEFHFDDCNLTAKWYTYTQAQGWFDNISIILLCRYTKVVKEDLGTGEMPTKKALLSEKEDLALSEFYSTNVFRGKVVSEPLALQETYWRKVFKIVKEDLGLGESYFVPNFFKMEKEDLGLSETYFTNRRLPKIVKEDLGLRERLWAKLTRGNIVITYDLTTKTDWNITPGVTTPWVKRKVIVT